MIVKHINGLAYAGGNGVTYSGFVNSETNSVLGGTLSYTGNSQNVVNAGSYTITPQGYTSNNYNLAYTNGTLTVHKADLTVTADNQIRIYGDANPTLTYGITGYVNSETSSVVTGTPNISTSATQGSNVGSYTITSAANNLTATNYQFSYVNGSLTVNQRPITVTAADKLKTYGDTNPSLTYAVAANGVGSSRGLYSTDTLTGALATTATTTTNVGTVSITQGTLANSNYAMTFNNGTLTIGKADLTVTADNQIRIYGDANPTLTYGITGYVNSETSSVVTGTPNISTSATQGSNVGSYTITSAANNLTATNYQFSYVNGSLTVNQRPITVTAADKLKTYGDTNPSLTYAVAANGVGSSRGLYSTDTLTGALATTATTTTNVGTVSITQGTLANSNYAMTFNNGTLTIGKADLTVTAANDSKTYNGLAYAGGNGVTYSGFVNSETNSVLGGTLSYTGNSQNVVNAGSYTITPQGYTSNNYNLAYTNGTLTVNKADLTVTAANDSKTYNGLAYAGGNGVTYSGFVNSETNSVLGGTLSYTGNSQNVVNAGSYTITPQGYTSNNYNLAYTNGTLTVNKADLTVTAANDSKTYNGLAYAGGNGVTYSGFVNSETNSVLGGTLSYTGNSQNVVNAGSYTITPQGYTSNNYNLAYTNGTLTVHKADLTVTADNQIRIYGDANPTLTYGITGYVNSETSSVVTGTPNISTSATQGSNVGSYTITSAANNLTATNYQFSYVNGSLTVNQRPITVTAADKLKTYGDTNPSLTYAVAANGVGSSRGLYSTDTLTGALATTATTTTNVGTVSITQGTLANSNYAMTFNNGTLTIGKADLTVTADNQIRIYGDANPTLTYGITGYVNSETSSVVTGTPNISTSATQGSNVGSYTITSAANNLTATNYQFSYVNGSLTVNQRPITVTAADKLKTYGDTNPSLTYAVAANGVGSSRGLYSTDTLTGALATTATTTTNVGTVSITQGTLANSNYAMTFNNGTLTIGKADLTVTAANDSKTYNGLAYAGGNGVTYSGFVNSETNSVLGGTLSYTGNSQNVVNAGSYTITPQGYTSNNYNLAYTNGTLTVNKADLTVTAANDSKTYNGLAYAGGNGVTYSGFVNSETNSVLGGTLSYTGNSQNVVNAGSYTITPQGYTSNNYNLAYTNGTLTVNKADLTVTAANDSKTYNGLAYAGGNGVTYSGFVNSETNSVLGGTLSYTGNSQNVVNAGSYTITPQGYTSNNYNLAYTNGTLTVHKADLTVTADNQIRIYGDANPTLTYGITGYVNSETSSVVTGTPNISTSATQGSNVGSYTITSAANNLTATNYQFSYVNGSLTVNQRPITVTAADKLKTYGDTNPSLTYAVAANGVGSSRGLYSTDTLTGALATTATTTTNVGTVSITQGTLANSNYAMTFNNGTLTIGKADLTVTAANDSKTYNGLAYAGGNGVTYSGFVNSETNSVLGGTLSYTGNSQNVVNAGSYTITPQGYTSNNYNLAYTNGTLTVNKADLTVTAANDSKTYNGLAYAGGNGVTYSGFVNSETNSVLGGTLSYTGNSQNVVNAGSYTITPQGYTSNNYNLAYTNGTLTVHKADLTVTADNQIRIYGDANPTLTYGITGYVNSETSSVVTGTPNISTSATQGSNVGSYTITSAANNLTATNYQFSYVNGSLTVNQRPITVTAADKLKTYGDTNPSLTYAVAANGVGSSRGLYSTDTLTGALATTATTTTNVGTVSITQGTLANSNYAMTFNNGTLTIGKADLTVTAANDSKTYNGLAYAGGNGVTYSGFVNSETNSVLGGTLSYTGNSQNVVNAGSYTITPQGYTSNNYNLAYTNGTLTVNKADLTVTAANDSKTYNGLAYAGGNGVTYSGFVNSETNSVLGGTLSYTGNSQNVVNAGSYTITPQGYTSNNYNLAYTNGTLTVHKADLTVTADNQIRIYGDANPTLTYGITGYVNSETSSVVTGTPNISTSATQGSNVGSYTITSAANNLTATNYQFSYVNGSLTVNQRPITVTAADKLKTYGDTNPSLTYAVAANGVGSSRGLYSTDTLTGALATTATTTTNVGTVSITQGTLANSNYAMTFNNGTLTIGKADLTVTGSMAYNGSIVFNGSNLAIQGVNGETFAATGLANMYSKNVQRDINNNVVSQRLADVNALTLTGVNGSLLSNYNGITTSNTFVTLTPLSINLYAPAINKTYDGGYTYTMTAADLANMSTQLVGGDRVSSANVIFSGSDPNVGNNKTILLGTIVINDGNDGENYNVSPNNSTGSITPANLTISAVDDARFVGQLDRSGYNGVVYNGFVNGEDAANNLSGSLLISRSDTLNNNAGTYVLTPSGLSANNGNYSINFINGTYQIIPANYLLVRVTPVTVVYGDSPTYAITAQYLDGNTNTINYLGNRAALLPRSTAYDMNVADSSSITIFDGTNNTATFNLGPAGAALTTSGSYRVGGYNIANQGSVVRTGANFLGAVVTGSINIVPLTLTLPSFTSNSISKVYDGTPNINNVSINATSASVGIIDNDLVFISASGLYNNENVGSGKAVTINLSLTGADKNNYALSTTQINSQNYGQITQLPSVSYVGQTGGNWSNASNWFGGAIPTLSNVAQVIIPTGLNVVYDNALLSSQNKSLSSATSIVNNGTLTFSGSNNFTLNNNVSGLGSINQSGAGILTLSGNNTYSGGTNISASTLEIGNPNALGSGPIASSGGSIRQITEFAMPSITVNGSVNVRSNILTGGNQTFNDLLHVTQDSSFISQAGNITFNKLTSAGHDIIIKAFDNITFNDQVGLSIYNSFIGPVTFDFANRNKISYATYKVNAPSFNPRQLYAYAPNININADITTLAEQIYDGAYNNQSVDYTLQNPAVINPSTLPATVLIGGASDILDGVAKVRTLVSQDPFVGVGKNSILKSSEDGKFFINIASIARSVLDNKPGIGVYEGNMANNFSGFLFTTGIQDLASSALVVSVDANLNKNILNLNNNPYNWSTYTPPVSEGKVLRDQETRFIMTNIAAASINSGREMTPQTRMLLSGPSVEVGKVFIEQKNTKLGLESDTPSGSSEKAKEKSLNCEKGAQNVKTCSK
jgi:hypothetical protein